MAYTPYFIGPYTVGLEKDLDSYLIPETAFPNLDNAYLWRGRVYKKGGTQNLGFLGIRQQILGTRGAGADVYNLNLNFTPILPGSLIITDDTTTFTDNGTGGFTITPVPGNGTVNAPTNYATGAINITFNVGNAGATVTASWALSPGANSPVMGLRRRDISDTPQEQLVAFDRVAAYRFDNTIKVFVPIITYKTQAGQTTTNTVAWTGSNTDFFYSMNYQGAFFATNNVPGASAYVITNITNAAAAQVTTSTGNNFAAGDVVYFNNVQGMTEINGLTGVVTVAGNPFTVNINSTGFSAYTGGGVAWSHTLTKANSGDGIRWYDGTGWVNFLPPLDDNTVGAPRLLQGARLLFAYKGYMVALNTFEGPLGSTPINFQNRARFSQYTSIDGSIFYAPPLPASNPGIAQQGAWWDTEPGFGGFIDCPTAQSIIAAEFIKDVLVVYFERSIYRLVATGNDIDPFVWEKINTEIGSDATFSPIPFDAQILSIGQNGVYACDSLSVDRVDRIIPDVVFEFQNVNNGGRRVQGIRDFYSEMVYWTFVDNSTPNVFPNRSLIYNYLQKSFSIFENDITCYGYYNTYDDLTWGRANNPWASYTRTWDDAINSANFPLVIAGNQQGLVFFVESAAGDKFATNAPSLHVTGFSNAVPAVITSPNHGLEIDALPVTLGDYIIFSELNGVTGINGNVYKVNTIPTADTFTLVDLNGAPVSSATPYTFGGVITIVDNFEITTKPFNPYFSTGKSARLGYVDFYIDNPDLIDGQRASIIVNLYLDDDLLTPVETQILPINDVIYPNNEKFWTRVYFNSQGEFLSLELTYSTNTTNADLPAGQIWSTADTIPQVVVHGMILWMKPTGRLLNV